MVFLSPALFQGWLVRSVQTWTILLCSHL